VKINCWDWNLWSSHSENKEWWTQSDW